MIALSMAWENKKANMQTFAKSLVFVVDIVVKNGPLGSDQLSKFVRSHQCEQTIA